MPTPFSPLISHASPRPQYFLDTKRLFQPVLLKETSFVTYIKNTPESIFQQTKLKLIMQEGKMK